MNPILVEPEIKYVLNHHLTTLKQINETKKIYYSMYYYF